MMRAGIVEVAVVNEEEGGSNEKERQRMGAVVDEVAAAVGTTVVGVAFIDELACITGSCLPHPISFFTPTEHGKRIGG
jgi:hypothetical protein